MMAVKAIVFDSNAFPKGRYVIATIERWATSCAEHEAELWIPEPVALELAQHILEEEAEHLAQLESIDRTRRKRGLGGIRIPERTNVEEVVSSMESSGAIILELLGTDAISALRDQVLLTGPAERKGGIKTGAADSAWVRAVCAELGRGESGDVIVVSGDKRASAFLCELAKDSESSVEVVGHLGTLLDRLGVDDVLVGGDLEDFVSSLRDSLEVGDDLSGIAGEIAAEEFWDEAYTRVPAQYLELQEVYLRTVGNIEPQGNVRRSDWTHEEYGDFCVEFEIEHAYAAQDAEGDGLMSVHVTGRWEVMLSLRVSREGLQVDRIEDLVNLGVESYIG